ncbi:gluconate 2-dehydrogenase subunit 3 family protein [Paludibaculum fermentans]|uniref:Gluconate 2-dehydrogenase subunit 3 family protein n=1 Tax=Paludibaculum fermentans TaxID=1473598 RepID=A0A7S7NV23_PALFE|nr:gluconate 2-dehydrogenase subunit 3 family protein [Paludibaculum fermentans]QOY90350.1 gluconate 2-dehydrogenase subunit 3 family protein [Paludibaculum fermentans]
MDLVTRRSLLLSALSAATLSDIAQAQQHAHSALASNAPFRYLTAADALELEALAAQIIPSGESPGAREAGCIHFIDRALETFDRDQRDLYRNGLAATQRKRAELFPQSRTIAGLENAPAIALVKAIEQTEFFKLLRTHTIMGFLAAPAWGGNQGMVGWTHIGLEHKMTFQPPFGFYDGEAK